jgi:hypothetical protein
VRHSVEKSIVDPEGKKKDLEEKRLFVNHSISELETLILEEAGLYGEYRKRIKQALKKERNQLKKGATEAHFRVDFGRRAHNNGSLWR